MARKIALVGIGKIARDQHIPAINADPDWTLAATVSRNASVGGVENFATIDALLQNRPDIGVVSLAIPPRPRFDHARKALEAGRHLMLEKPPGASLAECHALDALARRQGVALFATWHSRHAACVPQAKAWLATRRLRRMQIVWTEDVRRWHPGQDWIWEPGGMGVFDPGINALSIMTEILPDPVHVRDAVLDYPANRQTPIAARLTFAHPHGAEVGATFDWREEGDQVWDIRAETDDGTLRLSSGGAVMEVDGAPVAHGPDAEYPGLYRAMTALADAGACDVDLAPLTHVADAFMLGRRTTVSEFHE